jgi:hypothetical protein
LIGRYIPDWLRRVPEPGARAFALLQGLEASVRGLLVSVWPLVLYDALGDAGSVSLAYFSVGVASLLFGLFVPWIGRHVPRRWLYTAGGGLYLVGPTLGAIGGPWLTPLALLLTNYGTVTLFICVNAYIMDYIAREELGRSESLKMFYAATPWLVGPVLGVTLWKVWHGLPFLLVMLFASAMLATFWALRLGNGKVITRARAPAPNPLAYLARFARQPRLIAGWLFAVIRSTGWWVYVVYLPIFCIEAGMGDRIASAAFSLSNGLLFFAPLMSRWMQPKGLRRGMITAFACASGCFLVASAAGLWPPLAIGALFLGSVYLVMLDAYGGLPFLMAVRPAERTEMSAVYASFRDVSGIVTPGVSYLVLLVTPLPGVFAACAFGLAAAAGIATRLHPRLGKKRA